VEVEAERGKRAVVREALENFAVFATRGKLETSTNFVDPLAETIDPRMREERLYENV